MTGGGLFTQMNARLKIGKQARAVRVFTTDQERFQDDCLLPALKGKSSFYHNVGSFLRVLRN
jgi:hypothetical protein